eukprot:Seg16521.2 transcript_id=Seg16521.2/GoldUCD/mRNA.D3Y31 product="hypothetical protein" protein_id=Seg16521.2/GoldUCD/D3Y31
MNSPTIILLDNGSLRPEAILYLRDYAQKLSQHTGKRVEAISLLHSSKVDAELIGGVKAKILKRFLLDEGAQDYHIVPFFIGASRALTEYLPTVIAEVLEKRPDINITVAQHLADSEEDKQALASLLAKRIKVSAQQNGLQKPDVVVVDHGTPAPEVNAVRNELTDKVRNLLDNEAASVTASSMERREGAEYDFNEPLLEKALERVEHSDSSNPIDVIVSLLFLSPGRHAGAGGDIAEICEEALEKNGQLCIQTTELLSHDYGLLDILASRAER